jgi:hypothetical protein
MGLVLGADDRYQREYTQATDSTSGNLSRSIEGLKYTSNYRTILKPQMKDELFQFELNSYSRFTRVNNHIVILRTQFLCVSQSHAHACQL